MDEVARELGARARFVRVRVDPDSDTLERFGCSGLPAYLVFRDGVQVDRLSLNFTGWFLGSRLRRMLSGQLD